MFDFLLHRFDRTKVVTPHAVKLYEHENKLFLILEILVHYGQFPFPIGTGILVRSIYCALPINLFMAALRWLVVNSADRIFLLLSCYIGSCSPVLQSTSAVHLIAHV